MKLHVYVISSTVTQGRVAFAEKVVEELGKHYEITHEVVGGFEAHAIDKAVVDKHVDTKDDPDPSLSQFFAEGMAGFAFKHVRQISKALKHYEAIRLASEREPRSVSLVLEDDVLFSSKDWVARLREALEPLDARGEKAGPAPLVHLGEKRPSDNPRSSETAFSSTCAYALTGSVARTLVSAYHPVRRRVESHLRYAIKKASIEVLHPPVQLFFDGTKVGAFIGTVTASDSLSQNIDYERLSGMVSARTSTDEMFDAILVKEHPSVIGLRAVHKWNAGEHGEALALFKTSLAALENNSAIVNYQTPALKNAITMHRDMQSDLPGKRLA